MRDAGHLWAIVLAAGEGTRVRTLTTNAAGKFVPKQFCAMHGQDSLLRSTIRRAAKLVPASRIVVVVADQHRDCWENELLDLPENNIVVQPRNRGTANGILLPLLQVLQRDRMARILILPTDHYVENEDLLRESMVAALQATQRQNERVFLLGMTPKTADPDYGWIVPSNSAGDIPPLKVSAFVEKPDRSLAERLLQRGALLNSFIIVATASALLQLYDYAVPDVVAEFINWRNEAGERWPALQDLYRALQPRDFSRDVLEVSIDWLSVLPVRQCGWTDLGTPSRLVPFLRSTNQSPGDAEGRWSA
jgi:mannose-1-phosphate guanylyltransferase